jgi:hypothetical protein
MAEVLHVLSEMELQGEAGHEQGKRTECLEESRRVERLGGERLQ